MSTLTTFPAEQQTRALARGYIEDVLDALAQCPLPEKPMRGRILGGTRMVHAAADIFGSERVCIVWAREECPDDLTARAVADWCAIPAAELGQSFTIAGLSASQTKVRDDLAAQRAFLSRKRLRWFVGGSDQREDWLDHARGVLDVFQVLPVLAGDFAAVFAELATVAGFVPSPDGMLLTDAAGKPVGVTLDDLGEEFALDALRVQGEANARVLLDRREQILAWANEATHGETGGGAEVGTSDERRVALHKRVSERKAEEARVKRERKVAEDLAEEERGKERWRQFKVAREAQNRRAAQRIDREILGRGIDRDTESDRDHEQQGDDGFEL